MKWYTFDSKFEKLDSRIDELLKEQKAPVTLTYSDGKQVKIKSPFDAVITAIGNEKKIVACDSGSHALDLFILALADRGE